MHRLKNFFWFSVYKIVITKELLKITKETWENMV